MERGSKLPRFREVLQPFVIKLYPIVNASVKVSVKYMGLSYLVVRRLDADKTNHQNDCLDVVRP